MYIIESPSSVDLYNDRYECGMLCELARLNGVSHSRKIVTDKRVFEYSISGDIHQTISTLLAAGPVIPIIHISCHGSDKGISLTSGELITWTELCKLLVPINTCFHNSLLLSLSCCNGYSGVQIAMNVNTDVYPYLALISNSESPNWSETAIAYSTFYHNIFRGKNLHDARDAMMIASGNDNFSVDMADAIQKSYGDYVAKNWPSQLPVQTVQ